MAEIFFIGLMIIGQFSIYWAIKSMIKDRQGTYMNWEEEQYTLLLFTFLNIFLFSAGFREIVGTDVGHRLWIEWPVFGALLNQKDYVYFLKEIRGDSFYRPLWYVSYLIDYGRYMIGILAALIISRKVLKSNLWAGVFAGIVMPLMAVFVGGHEVGTYLVLTALALVLVYVPLAFTRKGKKREKIKAEDKGFYIGYALLLLILIFLVDTHNLFGRNRWTEPTDLDYDFSCCEGEVMVSLDEGVFFDDEISLIGDIKFSEHLDSPIGGKRYVDLLYKSDGFEMRGGGGSEEVDFHWHFDSDHFDAVRGWHEGKLYPFDFYGISEIAYWSDQQNLLNQVEILDIYWTEDKGYPAYTIIFEAPEYEGWETIWDIGLDIDYENTPYMTYTLETVEDKGETAITKRTVYFMEDFDRVGDPVDVNVSRCRMKKTFSIDAPIFTINKEEDWAKLEGVSK